MVYFCSSSCSDSVLHSIPSLNFNICRGYRPIPSTIPDIRTLCLLILLVRLARVLSILLLFIKNQLWILFIFTIVFVFNFSDICSCLYFLFIHVLGFYCSSFSRSLRYELILMIGDLYSFFEYMH